MFEIFLPGKITPMMVIQLKAWIAYIMEIKKGRAI
jgi:hypothetical protein